MMGRDLLFSLCRSFPSVPKYIFPIRLMPLTMLQEEEHGYIRFRRGAQVKADFEEQILRGRRDIHNYWDSHLTRFVPRPQLPRPRMRIRVCGTRT